MIDSTGITQFLRKYRASAVGVTPPRPELPTPGEPNPVAGADLSAEVDIADWKPIPLPETPAKPDETPTRFIDGSHAGQSVLCVRSPQGYPIAIRLAEVGAIALELTGRRFTRAFKAVERVVGFVADPFPWEEVETFATALANHPGLRLRVVPARMPEPPVPGEPLTANPFDYGVMQTQAQNRCQQEMLRLEALALASAPNVPTLIDGQLGGRINTRDATDRPLLVGLVKAPTPPRMPDTGYNTLLDLGPGQRSPYFHDPRPGDVPLASWFLRLASGSQMAPNWGTVRVDVPWKHLERHSGTDARKGFVDRLSRWLIDARCRADSYARMPVSLDPIVRAEDGLKPLFTPFPVLANRLYRAAGLFRRDEV